ncbi:O-antigen ligase family protein [Luteolibacter luteus]|uniref:O-antigen ligase family protein n=1 Tax=Luteolibacter luteus TaxID=2728835 RepID=A0A858RKK2_9BACT|nr:O-antigen ligase family protein [Luteolibacter luteus]QJE96988.1 O-antigen ligase family protein [Luteolibacter luteus]
MQVISGIGFAVALALAVSLGGQTLDYTWGPAFLALVVALLASIPQAWKARRGPGTWIPVAALALACGWILWRCSGSPVREFGRSDALLVVGMASTAFWGMLVRPGGPAIRIAMASLALLAFANLGIALVQVGDRSFAWPFASRPGFFPSGLFGHYNHLADFSLVAAIFLAARFIFARDRLPERILQVAGVLANAGCVFVSQSRGGIVSLCAASFALVVLMALVAWRDKSPKRKGLTVLAVAMPLFVAALAVPVLNRFQERRGIQDGSLERFADNKSRLHSIGLAVDVTANHPWAGGGSRAFGWEKYAAWKPSESGMVGQNDDFVHNELLQVATDYGWIGAVLVALAVFSVCLAGLAGIMGGEGGEGRRAVDALACGGLSAMVGTLVHSNFSFVTHTLPGALYLGLAIGCALPRRKLDPVADYSLRPTIAGGLLTLASLFLVAALGIAGAKGSIVYRSLWPVFFGKENLAWLAPGTSLERVHGAMETWPGSELAGSYAGIVRGVSQRQDLLESDRIQWLNESANLYGQASKLNPYDPEWAVNRANVLSILGRNEEAEKEFERAITLEGGMEGVFRARYYYAWHLHSRWYRAWTKPEAHNPDDIDFKERRASEALAAFLHARELLKEASGMTELWVRGQEEAELIKGLEETIAFLEGAQVRPAPRR